MIGVALISTQYFMINALSGAVLNLVCLIRTIFFYFAEDKIKMKSVKFTDFLIKNAAGFFRTVGNLIKNSF